MILYVFITCLALVAANESNITKSAAAEISINNSTKEILKASETSDPSKVEIVKQIRRLNEDGSYTVGYEADDGTFKIESRDVLGNVKGTFGYIDKDGEIKRVTYSSSSDSTSASSLPVTTSSTTSSTPVISAKVNKTITPTTRKPLATVVYPTRISHTTRIPVVQSIPRKRPSDSSTRSSSNIIETTTQRQQLSESESNILNLYKPKLEEVSKNTRTQILNPIKATTKDDLITKQTTTLSPQTVKPVYEEISEKEEISPIKANTIRRELFETSPNPHMVNLQQSMGDDSTDVYGSHLSIGTARPLFTTTTQRQRLVPIHSIVAARRKIQHQYQDPSLLEQETTVEANTGRVFDQENVVTSSSVPVIRIPNHRDQDDRIYEQQVYRRPPATVRFRTEEYLKENPGAAVPIGNQRPFFQYEFHNKVLDPPYVREPIHSHIKSEAEAATGLPYEIRPATRIIPIPVDENGIPLQGYQARFINPYMPVRPTPRPIFQRTYEPIVEEMNSISAPVSTRDLKRLLQILILRQNRLQALMDQIVAPGPPYQPLPSFRKESYDPDRYQSPRHYQDDQYDYRHDQQQYRQQESYTNQMSNYDNSDYESHRYVPRRRSYTRSAYDTAASSSNRVDDNSEYLPAEIREALLLKMLVLAISPDFMPTPIPITEMTTATPTRKQVRNVQILGEENIMKRKMRSQ